MSRRTIFVIGMGRSGTSTVAGILKNLGVEWGPDHLMIPPSEDNIRGVFEFTPLFDINVEILSRLGGHWHFPPDFPDGWQERSDFEDLRCRAREIIGTHFNTDLWGFKDPRCCLTLPFWRTVIENPIDCILVFRNPLEVCYSLLRRDQLPIENGAHLWLLNVAESLSSTKGLQRHFVSYDDILSDPISEILRIEKFLEGLEVSTGLRAKAIAFIGNDLRHERVSMEDLFRHQAIPYLVKAAYSAIRLFVLSQRVGSDEGLELVNDLLGQRPMESGN